MNPYQPHYGAGYGQHQQQAPASQQAQLQRPYIPTQLPPISSGMGMPTPPSYVPGQPTSGMAHTQPSLPPPPRPTHTSSTGEKKLSTSTTRGDFRYSLEVVQQPQRARMCGFGDKDRRPITPPPCVRLVIVDVKTGREVDLDDLQCDASYFVLQVDLWSEGADREANVVRAASNSPAVSISSATTTSYPPPMEAQRAPAESQPVMYMNSEGQPIYASVPSYAVSLARPMAHPQYGGALYYQQLTAGQSMQPFLPPATQSPSAMYTRNLIGSLTVNASRLNDNEGKPGYWFVLQDLSVRTEGFFRLRMSFTDISNNDGSGPNRGKAPYLASTFSDVFQVYSAKKFPGVIESTPLSKCFAGQGIKIPIRKDTKGDQGDDDDGD